MHPQQADGCGAQLQSEASEHIKKILQLRSIRPLMGPHLFAGFAVAWVVVEVALVDQAEAGEGEHLVDLADVF